MKQLVAADVGNSSVKLQLLTKGDGHSSYKAVWPDSQSVETDKQLRLPEAICGQKRDWLVSSVSPENSSRLRAAALEHNSVERWRLVDRHWLPISLEVDEPNLVGIDRLLAVYAAWLMCHCEKDVIVVDCGTAMTIDLISSAGVFRGGVIIAGPQTNLRALSSMTSALPDLSGEVLQTPDSPLGRNTRAAMLSGAWYNGLGAIREVVEALSRCCSDTSPTIVGTGGGLGPWRKHLPDDWQIVDNLVLGGIAALANTLPENDELEA